MIYGFYFITYYPGAVINCSSRQKLSQVIGFCCYIIKQADLHKSVFLICCSLTCWSTLISENYVVSWYIHTPLTERWQANAQWHALFSDKCIYFKKLSKNWTHCESPKNLRRKLFQGTWSQNFPCVPPPPLPPKEKRIRKATWLARPIPLFKG